MALKRCRSLDLGEDIEGGDPFVEVKSGNGKRGRKSKHAIDPSLSQPVGRSMGTKRLQVSSLSQPVGGAGDHSIAVKQGMQPDGLLLSDVPPIPSPALQPTVPSPCQLRVTPPPSQPSASFESCDDLCVFCGLSCKGTSGLK